MLATGPVLTALAALAVIVSVLFGAQIYGWELITWCAGATWYSFLWWKAAAR